MIQRVFRLTGILSLFLLLLGSAYAQDGKLYTLDECIQIGLKHNSEFRNAANRVDRSGADVRASYATILPQVTSTFQSGKNARGRSQNAQEITQFVPLTLTDVNGTRQSILATKLDPATGGPVIDRIEFSSPTLSFWDHTMTLRYSQTLFDFGRSWNTIKQAKASFSSSSQALTAARQKVYADVKQRYLELLKALKLQQEYTEAVARSQEELEKTQSMFEIGSVAQIDVYRQEVTLGTDKINLINQQNVVKIARANLNVAMGRDAEEPIRVADVPPVASGPGVPLDKAYEIAEENNPDLQRFRFDMKSAEYGRKVAKGSFMPSIGVGATYSRNNEQLDRVYGGFDKNYFLSAGATVTFNIFNGFADVAEVHRQTANYSIAKENWISERHNLHLKVKQAYLNLQGYNEIAKINETIRRSAEEEYRLAQERYRVGAGTQLEVTEAQVSLTRARVQVVSSRYDAMIAEAQLAAAMGTVDKTAEQ